MPAAASTLASFSAMRCEMSSIERRRPSHRRTTSPSWEVAAKRGVRLSIVSSVALRTMASTESRREGSSRRGPAGSAQLLPSPRAPTTASSTSRARRRCCRPSSLTITLTLGLLRISRRPAATRSRPTATGTPVARRIKSGSSPTVLAGESSSTRCCSLLARPYPRLMTPGVKPAASSSRTSSIVMGVLPVPPT